MSAALTVTPLVSEAGAKSLKPFAEESGDLADFCFCRLCNVRCLFPAEANQRRSKTGSRLENCAVDLTHCPEL
ncbi:hypothetical protein BaRGS_00012004 [Batillaria attramentaria]|uniref:Uncharacterized protein n=1 Tax=Batillaria attramentaria TaxID=370345 RepID=A0ABD0LBZ6_9CAEN